jgi:predicted glycosyltransferase
MTMIAKRTLPDAARFLFYSHDGMGLGHTRRNLAIAAALVEQCPRASVLLASGTDDAHRLGLPPHVEVLKLPGLRKAANDEYTSRRLPVHTDEIRELRASLLEAAIKSFRPAVALVDKHPFGARGEFRAGLEMLKARGGRAVLGLRDILDDPAVVRREWAQHHMQERIAEFYDRVFVYGDRALFDPIAAYTLPPAVAERAAFCGYVVNRDVVGTRDEWPEESFAADDGLPVVLATAGGGEDGFALLENFLAASEGAPWRGIASAGPMTPDAELEQLRTRAGQAKVIFRTFIPRLPARFHSLHALVCMGGYNTLVEAALHAIPTVCVPRVAPRSEQLLRAKAFERLGLLQLIHPRDLTPASLRAALGAALSTPRLVGRPRVGSSLNFDGAQAAARELIALAERSPSTSRSLAATVPQP